MTNGPERGRGMRDLSKGSVEAANKALRDEELALLRGDADRLERLRPQLAADGADFEKLLAAVRESTEQNESVAQLQDRLKALGGGVLAVARKAIALV